jgi:hypothetical protein
MPNEGAQQFILSLYRHLLRRTPGASELEHWVHFLESGNSSEAVYYSFVNSKEFRQRTEIDSQMEVGSVKNVRTDVMDMFSGFDLDDAETHYLI